MIGLVQRVLTRNRLHETVALHEPSPDLEVSATVEPEPEPEPELELTEQLIIKARRTCAEYCVTNNLTVDDLRDLLEQLGLIDGEVFRLSQGRLPYLHV